MIPPLRIILLVIAILGLSILMIVACDDNDTKLNESRQAEAQQAQAQLQAQLQSEQQQRQKAEESARAAEQSRTTWIAGLCAGAAVACVVILLVGIHIGSRARNRIAQEKRNG